MPQGGVYCGVQNRGGTTSTYHLQEARQHPGKLPQGRGSNQEAGMGQSLSLKLSKGDFITEQFSCQSGIVRERVLWILTVGRHHLWGGVNDAGQIALPGEKRQT